MENPDRVIVMHQRRKQSELRACPAMGILARAALIFAFTWSGCIYAGALALCAEDQACLREFEAVKQVKNVKFWNVFQKLPIERRVLVAPRKLIEYLDFDNRLQGFPNRPRAAAPLRPFLQDMAAAISEMPPAVITLIDKKLMGIFLVEDLGGTGFTDTVFDDRQQPVGAFIVLDVGVLTRHANAWATWKENTPFVDDPDFTLQAIIEDDANDNRKQALQYILLHELGHVASVGNTFHPPWDSWDCVADPPGNFPFFELSWQLSEPSSCEVISRFDRSGFDQRSRVVYYFGARLPQSTSPGVYAQLEKTNFPSLYAASSPADDFAESFVTYVHTVLMGRPFAIHIDKKGVRQTTFTACWKTERCAAKQEIMAGLFTFQVR